MSSPFTILRSYIFRSSSSLGNGSLLKYESLAKRVHDSLDSHRWSYPWQRRSERSFGKMWKITPEHHHDWYWKWRWLEHHALTWWWRYANDWLPRQQNHQRSGSIRWIPKTQQQRSITSFRSVVLTPKTSGIISLTEPLDSIDIQEKRGRQLKVWRHDVLIIISFIFLKITSENVLTIWFIIFFAYDIYYFKKKFEILLLLHQTWCTEITTCCLSHIDQS